jgi:hypothetical protein
MLVAGPSARCPQLLPFLQNAAKDSHIALNVFL